MTDERQVQAMENSQFRLLQQNARPAVHQTPFSIQTGQRA